MAQTERKRQTESERKLRTLALDALQGTVIRGEGIGRTIGYPTANIDISITRVPFTLGVYAATTTLQNKVYQGALVIRDHPWKIEMHLFDYTGDDFYGEKMAISPLQKISMIEKVDSLEELKEKISKDIQLVKDHFGE